MRKAKTKTNQNNALARMETEKLFSKLIQTGEVYNFSRKTNNCFTLLGEKESASERYN